MATNNFKPFATAANANVTSQADWETLPALLSGFTAGKASSAQVNKAIRQASFIAAALAQYTANKSGLDVLDDGDLNGFIAKMSAAFGKDFQALDATLTALAGLTTGANKLPYFNGNDTAALTDLTQVGRDIIGKSTIADILTYLGLGDGSALPVGVPVPWPLPNPPQGWLKYNGAPFDKIMFPKLGAIYPSGILPDLRGEFIRGWDDGRGVDSGRTLLSLQYASTIGRFVSGTSTTGAVGVTVFGSEGASPGDSNWAGVATGLPTKIVQQMGDGVRPRNIAFNYIVRAA